MKPLKGFVKFAPVGLPAEHGGPVFLRLFFVGALFVGTVVSAQERERSDAYVERKQDPKP